MLERALARDFMASKKKSAKSHKATRALELARVIHDRRAEILRRWQEWAEADLAPGIALTELRDGLPDYLDALVELLRGESGESLRGESGQALPAGQARDSRAAEQAWTTVAREHGITRVRIGFDIGELVHEFILLRRVIREIAIEEQAMVGGTDVRLSELLDAGIATSVQAYVEARDFESRKQEAEHIGFLTHELRNPLSAAVMATGQLRLTATPEQHRLLDVLERNHRRLAGLIDGVLLTEKLEAGKVAPAPVEVELGTLLESALEAARAAAAQKGLAFRASYDGKRIARVDPDLTRSAIQNVADNAVRYTDRGSVEIAVAEDGGALVIHVRDSCPGLSDEELSTIFEPFKRGRSGKSGTGLGLAIARRAIEAQGGTIEAESKSACGCHFWITLPDVGVRR